MEEKLKFKEFCRAMLVPLDHLSCILNDYYPGTGLEIYIGADGYISFSGNGMEWQFLRLDSHANPEIRLEIKEPLSTDDLEGFHMIGEVGSSHIPKRMQVNVNSEEDCEKD